LISDLALVVIPSGIVGARIYHVITTPEKYFNSHFLDAFKIWEGGLGIWGAIAGGSVAGFFYLRKKNEEKNFYILADALAPGLLIAQAIGRFGNWFNGELFGQPSNLPWALSIPMEKRPVGFENYAHFQPTFLYEAIWCTVLAILISRIKFKVTGQAFWFYVASYSLGRMFIESIRIDFSHKILGARLNVWVALICFFIGVFYFQKLNRKRVG
jgi:prolipoprotein diacylglyceryl transferase